MVATDSAPAAGAGAGAAPQPATVGEQLRQARLAQNASLEQLATELRIEARHLRALEENRFSQIGVQVFIKGYLRQYGARLGLDVNALLERYRSQGDAPEVVIQPSRTIKLHDESQTTLRVVALAALIALIVFIGIWWFNNNASFGIGARPADDAPSEAVPVPIPEPAQAPASAPSAPSAPPPADPTLSPAPAPAVASSSDVIVQPDAPAAPAAVPVSLEVAAPNALAESQNAVPVAVTFLQESWLEITDGSGARLFYGLGAAGRELTLRGAPPFAVVAGNTAGLRLHVDGAEIALPNDAAPGNMARFTVGVPEPPED